LEWRASRPGESTAAWHHSDTVASANTLPVWTRQESLSYPWRHEAAQLRDTFRAAIYLCDKRCQGLAHTLVRASDHALVEREAADPYIRRLELT
jgi:hypothetical protein